MVSRYTDMKHRQEGCSVGEDDYTDSRTASAWLAVAVALIMTKMFANRRYIDVSSISCSCSSMSMRSILLVSHSVSCSLDRIIIRRTDAYPLPPRWLWNEFGGLVN